MTVLTISQLVIYPVKSLRGFSIKRLQLGEKGPNSDRRWMVVDLNGKFRTQRQHPRLCLIDTHLDNGILTLSAQGFEPCQVGMTPGSAQQVRVWRDSVAAVDCGDEAAQWLTRFIGVGSRLVYMPSHGKRLVDQKYAKHNELLGFADAFPVLLTSETSLENFNSRLSVPIGMNRFRPNIVISGSPPYAEDEWQQIKIAGVNLTLAGPCSRCIMPSINPETAEKQMEIIDALKQHRRREGATYFGQNILYQECGKISVGDCVEIVR